MSYTPTLFSLVILDIGYHIIAQAGLDGDSSIYTSHVAGVTGAPHQAQLYWLRWGDCLTNFFPKLALNYYLSHLHLLGSWDDRCGPLSLALGMYPYVSGNVHMYK